MIAPVGDSGSLVLAARQEGHVPRDRRGSGAPRSARAC